MARKTKQELNALHDARQWLGLGVIALAVAGLFAIILVAARTPQLAIFTDLFSVALVVHVDLSVLMWFLAVGGMGWALLLPQDRYRQWRRAGFYCAAAATALMTFSPIDPHWQVIKSNYIPVLNNLPFLLGLGLLAAATVVMTLPVVYHYATHSARRNLPHDMQGFVFAAFTTLLAIGAFFLAGYHMPADNGIELRFETLFWSGGHILQVSYTLLMMAAWITLIELLGGKALNRTAVQLSYVLTLITAIAHFMGFALYPFDSPEFIFYHTRIMISLGGLGAALLMILVVSRYLAVRGSIKKANRAYASALVSSLVVFVAGGALGLLITGQNVTIPAHYHGAIVGVTLALMGMAYAMLPRFGYKSVAGTKLAFWQPIVYAIGQLMHVGGLAYSGGYGVLRKTPAGETPHLATDVQAALGFLGLGGLLAIIGGLLFVIVMGRGLLRRG